jgi:hypothetical protein
MDSGSLVPPMARKIRADEDEEGGWLEPNALLGHAIPSDDIDALGDNIQDRLLELLGRVSELKHLLLEADTETFERVYPRLRSLLETVKFLPLKSSRPATAKRSIGFKIEKRPRKHHKGR